MTRTLDEMNLPLAEGTKVDVVLRRGGGLRGTCRFHGKALESFTITYWQDIWRDRESLSFSGRSDGTFEIESVPAGELYLIASSSTQPENEPVRVVIEPGETAEVELEVAEAIEGTGMVVDASSGEPIPGSLVQPVLMFGSLSIGERGDEVQVHADGSFELHDLPAKDVKLLVRAPGYPPQEVTGTLLNGPRIEFGRIRLGRSQELVVRVDGAAAGEWVGWEFAAFGNTPIPYAALPGSGELVVQDVTPGQYYMCLFGPDFVQEIAQVLTPGRPWRTVLALNGGARIDCKILGKDGLPAVDPLKLVATFRSSPDSPLLSHTSTAREGAGSLERLPGGEVFVSVHDMDGATRAGRFVTLEQGERNEIEIVLSDSLVHVRVVDDADRPIAGALVVLDLGSDPAGAGTWWSGNRTSSAEGTVDFCGLDFRSGLVGAFHPAFGMATEALSSDPSGRTEVQIVLGSANALRVEVLDGEHPVGGAELELGLASGTETLRCARMNSRGQAEFWQMSKGDYSLSIQGVNVWPTRQRIEFRGGSSRIPVHVRARGDLTVAVVDAQGEKMMDAQVVVRSLDQDLGVAQELRWGRIDSSSAGLTADEDGLLQLRGLPGGK